ncbi:DUF2309 domain-containing protein [Mycolicibacterium hodleri]|uniref:Probable inorganic carbon transporter subunit DabA n=1 Tax=Mycolicibacterium hodleri TaxID=49897 RepID=A0A502E4G6_9MYCO|nr:DUF2309 domain-containing protein [Mycolicibacterium hodleri]TPG32533.1 DUF2309 domain-containing protein [Mycolicibacterium hodleri]
MSNPLFADPSTRRAQLRSEITLAARILPTHYPLETFIAVNPLAGLEATPFEQAIRRSGDLYGARGTLPEKTFRELHRDGRITDADLDEALTRRYPNLLDRPTVRLGEREFTPIELVRGDLIHGRPAPEPLRRYRIRSEQVGSDVAVTVDTQTAKWCSAFFGAGAWPMPSREAGFYMAWRALAPSDPSLTRAARAELRSVAERADDAALAALSALGIDDDARITYLQAHLTRLPGWAAHVHWCTGRGVGIELMEYLAVRLTYESLLLGDHRRHRRLDQIAPHVPSARERATRLIDVWGLAQVSETELAAAARVLTVLPMPAREMLWQNAFECHYRNDLLAGLSRAPARGPARAHTQVVSCIDTRSEGLRRHLESLDGYQTLGFAGFFAVAIRFTDLLGGAANDLCPVLISPSLEVREAPAPRSERTAARQLAGARSLAGAESAFHAAKESFAAPFVLAEAAGWAAGPLSAAKTFTPAISAGVRRRLRGLVAPHAPAVLDVETMPLAERALFARVALTTMGLVRGFGRLVVLCGHGSVTENNPYQAALDCGACGGQAGGPNARTAAAILNQAEVREELRQAGTDIPEQTYFIAAQHDTASDRVSILDFHLIPGSHLDDVRRLDADLTTVGASLAAERCAALPGARWVKSPRRAARHVAARSADWAQVYPEWGLAGNAAFVIAPREISLGTDLHRRVFLHSYDADVDPDGSALETILTAPLVVAQWINCQYYFSTVAPEVFGAGTKTIHNVVGTVGVMAGPSGDLRLGLPWQSVAEGDRLRHEPLRLLAVIQAPLERIDTVIAQNPILQHLFGNDWVGLAARADSGGPWQRWSINGWRSWFEADSTASIPDEETVR